MGGAAQWSSPRPADSRPDHSGSQGSRRLTLSVAGWQAKDLDLHCSSTSLWILSMRVVIQRVLSGGVRVEDQVVAHMGPRLVILLGIGPQHSDEQVRFLVEKIINLGIFEDEAGKMNLSLRDVG